MKQRLISVALMLIAVNSHASSFLTSDYKTIDQSLIGLTPDRAAELIVVRCASLHLHNHGWLDQAIKQLKSMDREVSSELLQAKEDMLRNYLNYNTVAILIGDTLDIDETEIGTSIVNTALVYDRYVELNPQGDLIAIDWESCATKYSEKIKPYLP